MVASGNPPNLLYFQRIKLLFSIFIPFDIIGNVKFDKRFNIIYIFSPKSQFYFPPFLPAVQAFLSTPVRLIQAIGC
jgi:hypothetical protein